MSNATFRTPSGGDPVAYILQLAADVVPTQGDALYAAQRQRTRIVERTLNRVDCNGQAFEPYSQNGPYYYYPNGRVGRNKVERAKNKRAVSRLLGIMSDVSFDREMYGIGRSSGGIATRGGEGIRFESYADFKLSLGRAGVDLMGPKAPHMLNALAVGTGFDRSTGGDVSIGIRSRMDPGTQIVIGIYGDEAGRATAHNTGESPRWKNKHQRQFLGASETDLQAMVDDIQGRCIARIKQNVSK